MTDVFRFRILAAPTAQTVPRLINLFAQRDVMPTAILARLQDDELSVVIDVADLARNHAEIVAEKMRCSVLVSTVELSMHPAPSSRTSSARSGAPDVD